MAKRLVDAGAVSRILDTFTLERPLTDEGFLEHIRSALSRGLPEVGEFRAHGRRLAVAAGGPSLEDTWRDLDGVIAAVNGSLRFLLERDVTPWACAILDPREHMVEIVERRKGVIYFVASTAHPALFDALLRDGCQVVLWHPMGVPGLDQIPTRSGYIGGGATMGTRWLCLGYYMGFRRFDLHGFDSSFRGARTHAYDDYRDGIEGLEMMGYRTSINFLEQVDDFVQLQAMFGDLPESDRPSFRLHGDGLLQAYWRAICSTSSVSTTETTSAAARNTSPGSGPASSAT